MEVYKLPLGPFGTNCYVAVDENGRAAVIDPGLYAPELQTLLREKTAAVETILLTHGHADHISGAAALREATGAPISIHTLDNDFTDGPLCMADECGYPFAPFRADRLLEDGDTVAFGKETMTVLHTPGHTPGSVCFLCGELLFSGDTLFAGSCGRTDLPGGSGADILRSLRRLAELPGNYTVCPGHGELSTLDEERQSNFYIAQAMRQAAN